ncbi:MAG TPA: hypothetical protein VD927_09700 [Chryseosolibacter sp.]|nr:hypothetical protein [Chryseosolibacter sp.]
MVRIIFVLLFSFAHAALAQLPFTEQQFLAKLQPGGGLPSELLKSKSVVFHTYNLTDKELETIQKGFQRTGIDAVTYYDANYVCAGRDVLVKLAGTLNRREIENLIYIQKDNDAFHFYIMPYNKKANLVEDVQPAWTDRHRALDYLLQQLYRKAASELKNENLLINDLAETGFSVNIIEGNRNEFYAIDLKVDMLAVPKFGIEEMDQQLEEIMKQFPYKYALTEAHLSEADLRKQGYFYVLRFVRAKNKVAREILDYENKRPSNAFVSVRYIDKVPALKSIHQNDIVFKFYFKHIDSGNVFLGTKWDADQDWLQALQNQLTGYKIEFRLE